MKTVSLFNVQLSDINNYELLYLISEKIRNYKKITISYVTFHTINLFYNNHELQKINKDFFVVHLDGIGLYWGVKLLFKEKRFIKRFTGSDFYPKLINECKKNNWKVFIFGDKQNTLDCISKKTVDLNIVGMQNGYNYDNNSLISSINNSKPHILIVGLGQPKQEKWIVDNKDKLDVNVILAVGDGIKVFPGTKKRGSKIVQFLGFEWLVRLVNNPKLYWKRYLLGIPLFIFRIIILKFKLLFN